MSWMSNFLTSLSNTAPQHSAAGLRPRNRMTKKMARWIITNDGKTAWDWDDTSDRRKIEDADKFIKERVEAGDEIGCDDRGMGFVNVWD